MKSETIREGRRRREREIDYRRRIKIEGGRRGVSLERK